MNRRFTQSGKLLLLFLLLLPAALMAQTVAKTPGGKFTISGHIKDASNSENLIGAIVSVKGTQISVATNPYGFYSLSLNEGKYTLEVRYMGYETFEKTIDLKKNESVEFQLQPAQNQMQEVVISADKANKNVQNTQMGAVTVSVKSVKQLPALLGEADVIRTIQLLPGVSTVGEGAPGYNVRGGGVDQNLVLLDEAPVYNGSHLLGFFSVFNPDAVKDLNLLKSEMPARFGGRLSSMLDVRMKEGNAKDYSVSGGIGTVSSRLLAEGPLQKDKSSFIVAGRRSYADLFLKLSSDSNLRNTSVYFYDLSAKLNFSLSPNDRLFVSGYSGRDVNKLGKVMNMNWGNATTTMRWNHIYNPKLFSNISLIYSNYDYMLGASRNEAESFDWKSNIVDYSVKGSWGWYLNPSNTIYYGLDVLRHDFSPGKARPTGSGSAFNEIYMPSKRAYDYALFWDHESRLSRQFSFQYGVRYSVIQLVSDGNTTVYDYVGETGKRKTPINPVNYQDGETIQWYHNLEPRFTAKWQTSSTSAVKASYTRTVQNLHYMSNTIAATPLDIWLPGSPNIKPQLADQVSAGYFYAHPQNVWEASAEIYYRDLKNQIDFVSGAETLLNKDIEGDMLFGNGRAFGSEWMLRKNTGRLNGWISYTLSRAERKIEGINNNQYYPAKYDKTHMLSLVGIYEYKPRTVFSATFTYSTGAPATFPDNRFDFDGFPVQHNSENSRNGYRLPAYHRLDLAATFKGKTIPGRRYHSEWVVSLYNALGRKNPYSIYFRQNEDVSSQTEAVRYAIIGGIVPSVTWNFKF
ncbi:MAG TPA: TonB-dependent receptor [Daejeonella sp.]|nr:TonB-dependent receptor [Daejeonella sp.]